MRSKLLFLIVLILTMAALSGTVQAGEALYERWDSDGDVDPLLTDTSTPDYIEMLTSLEYGPDIADYYRARITALIVPPVTGDYTFWLVGDNQSRIWLSTDSDPANAVEIARESTWGGGWDGWEDDGESESDPIALVGGTRYWLRAAHQETDGGDYIRVGWGSTDAGIPDHTVITEEYLGSDSYSHSPDPPSNSKVAAPGLVDLKWENETAGTCNVYWDDGSADVNDLNFQWHMDTASGEITLIGTVASSDPNEVTGKSVVADRLYHWRVDVGSMPGGVWNFSTINDPPDVDAGLKQALWLPATPGSVTFQLAPTVSDDGLPIPPGALKYQWTDSGPGTVVYDPPGGATKAPTATMTVAGDYTLTLTVSDGLTIPAVPPALDNSDTVKIRVHANDTTGLEARYDCEEADSAWGIHDDYSGAPKNPIGTEPPFDYSNGTRRGERMDDIDEPGMTATTMDQTGGHTGGGIIFDGETGHVQASNSFADPNWQPATWADLQDEVTLAAWIKIDPATGWDNGWETIISKGYDSDNDDGAYLLCRNGNGDGVQMYAYGVTPSAVSSIQGVNDGSWHHVVGTYDGAHLCIYVDAVQDACVETDGAQMNRIASPLTFGETLVPTISNNSVAFSAYATPFGGTMDEIRIHSIGLPHASDAPEATPLDGNNARSIRSIYRTSGGHVSCGGIYLVGDVNDDCYVNMDDVKIMAQQWLECNSISETRCDNNTQ